MAVLTQVPTSRQGSNASPGTVVEGPSAWTAADYKTDQSYVLQLSPEDVAELDAAVSGVAASGLDLKSVTLSDVSLPGLGPKLLAALEVVRLGRGFALLRGVPVLRYSRWESVAAYWIIGLHWGTAVSQNKKGHLVGHVKDLGLDPSLPTTRIYATSIAQPWHNDSSELVGLLCLRTSESGGESAWCSSVSVHNEIVRRRPDLAAVLSGPGWYYDRKEEVPKGKLPYFPVPFFSFHQGYLSVNLSPDFIRSSQRHADVPRLTPAHHEALKLYEEVAASPALAMRCMLQPGDLQLLNNQTCSHTRTAYVNGTTADTTRHLLRLWLSPKEHRPLSDDYTEIMGGSLEGVRGGIHVDGFTGNIPLEAE